MNFDISEHGHIGIDLDETLANTFPGMLAYAHSLGQLLHIDTIEEIKKHDASGFGNEITAEEARSLWEGYGKSTMNPITVPIVEGSRDGMKLLYEQGKQISIITARSNQDSWKVERTLSWINTHFPYISKESIHFVNHFSSESRPKSTVCKEYGVSLMIDDAIENAYELCTSGVQCILLERPWNRDIDFDHPYLFRVKNWKEIISMIGK